MIKIDKSFNGSPLIISKFANAFSLITPSLPFITEVVQKFGGEYLVRNGEYQCVEGETKFPRIVVIKFPSYEKALEWYNSDEYKPVKQIRLNNSEGSNIIIKGV